MHDEQDRKLGMNRKITRRDFLDGMALAIGGVAVASGGEEPLLRSEERAGLPAYPPTLHGLRGDQDQVFEFAHKLRDGKSWETFGALEDDGEHYDLIVVGAGISGL